MIHCVAAPQFVCPFLLCWTLGAFHLLAVGSGVTVNIHEPCLSVCGSSVFFWGLVPRRRIAGSDGHPALNFLWNPILVASVLHNPPAGLRGLIVPHPHQHRLLSFFFFSVTTLEVVKQYLVVVLICVSLITNGVEHIFTFQLAVSVSSW